MLCTSKEALAAQAARDFWVSEDLVLKACNWLKKEPAAREVTIIARSRDKYETPFELIIGREDAGYYSKAGIELG
jgi:hypothetical protein